MFNRKTAPKYILATILASWVWACTHGDRTAPSDEKPDEPMQTQSTTISKEEALRIAHQSASQAYRDLSVYRIEAELKDGNWLVDYYLKDPGMVGGGPHFVISAATGEIVSSRFAQ